MSKVMSGELSAAQEAVKQAPSRTTKALVERLRQQLAVKEKQQKVCECRDLGVLRGFKGGFLW